MANTATPYATTGAEPTARWESSPRASQAARISINGRNGDQPTSVNFVTAHDGFTLRDLVTYHEKRNMANGEENRDGESHNRSWNCGVEGSTRERSILKLRVRQQRNFLATLLAIAGNSDATDRRRVWTNPKRQ